MLAFVIITLCIGLISYFFLRHTRQVDVEEEADIETMDQEETSPAENAEEKTQIVEETLDDLKNRLMSLSNPDSEKPFAKISTPDISELPATPVPAAEVIEEKLGKKTVKPKQVSEASETSDSTPKKKSPYKKRAPKEKIEKKDS